MSLKDYVAQAAHHGGCVSFHVVNYPTHTPVVEFDRGSYAIQRSITMDEFESLIGEAKIFCGDLKRAAQLPDDWAPAGFTPGVIRWVPRGHPDSFAVTMTPTATPSP